MNKTVAQLIEKLNQCFGDEWSYYGTVKPVDDNMGFWIKSINALFSVSTHGGTLRPGLLDVQVESKPPGEYIFTGEYDIDGFLRLVNEFDSPIEEWPVNVC